MGGGIEDAADEAREKAMWLAKENYPGVEIVEHDWRKVRGWQEKRASYLTETVHALARGDAALNCSRCEGTGFERIIRLYTSWIKCRVELVYWVCRNCYGSGYVIGKADKT